MPGFKVRLHRAWLLMRTIWLGCYSVVSGFTRLSFWAPWLFFKDLAREMDASQPTPDWKAGFHRAWIFLRTIWSGCVSLVSGSVRVYICAPWMLLVDLAHEVDISQAMSNLKAGLHRAWILMLTFWSGCFSLVSGFGRLYLWKGFRRSIAPWMFFADLAMLLGAFISIFGPTHAAAQTVYSQLRLLVEIGLPVYLECLFTVVTWAFGYVGPRSFTLTMHLHASMIRLALCFFCLYWVYSSNRLGLIYGDAVRGLKFLAVAAGFHLVGAFLRRYRFLHDGTVRLQNPMSRLIHPVTRLKMAYLTLEEQKEQRQAARMQTSRPDTYMSSVGSYWYYPTQNLDHLHVALREQANSSWFSRFGPRLLNRIPLPDYFRRGQAYTRLLELDDTLLDFDDDHDGVGNPSLRSEGLFCRCECCVDGEEPAVFSLNGKATAVRQRSDADMEVYASFRSGFLQCCDPRWSLRTVDSPALDGEPLSHQLCARCLTICLESTLIDRLHGHAYYHFMPFARQFWTFEPVTEESFPLYGSASGLRDSALAGCHLCNIIWHSLNEPQQKELLAQDQLSAASLTGSNTGVYVKILSPFQNLWPGRSKGQIPKNALRLVPHFGAQTTARFWMEQKSVLRAHALGRDPVVERHSDAVDPIFICATDSYTPSPFGPPLGTHTGSPASLKLIRTWLSLHDRSNQCHGHPPPNAPFHDHEPLLNEAPPIPYPISPARLIDLGHSLDEIRLVERITHTEHSTIPLYPQYVALSYVWGKHQPLLKTETYNFFRFGVRISTLPATHQDAIAVTRGLGIRYLWIDALCIIQDSEEDKAREIQSMHDVYSNAHFVVAAVAAMDSSKPFLVEQQSLASSACFLSTAGMRNVWENQGGIFATTRGQASAPSADELHLSRFRSRGWIFQEECLAQRVLYFCDRKVMMRCNDCRKTFAMNRQPGGNTRQMPDPFSPGWADFSWLVTRPFKAVVRWIMHGKGPSAIDYPWLWAVIPEDDSDKPLVEAAETLQRDLWWKLVERYTERTLTVPSDKLPALQGLATRFEQKINASPQMRSGSEPVQYSFGLWVGDYFATALLWYLKDSSSKRPSHRAPSWSWAAVDGIVTNDSLEGNTSCDACGLEIIHMPTDTMPRIVVKTVIKSATWHRSPGGTKQYYIGHDRSVPETIERYQDLAQYVPLTEDPTQGSEVQALRADGREVGYVIWDTSNDIPFEGTEVQCLRIIVQPKVEHEKEDFRIPWATRGLVVLRTGTSADEYRRIGYFELHKTPGGIAFPTSLAPAQQRAYRWPAPEIDVHGFFKGCDPTTVTIV